MYCRKCGKKIDYDSEYCIECKAEAAAKAAYAEVMKKGVEGLTGADSTPQPSPSEASVQPKEKDLPRPKNPKLYGLTKGILSAAFGLAALMFALIALVITIKISFPLEDDVVAALPTEAMSSIGAFFILSVAMGVPALILGIHSIKAFKLCVKAGWEKPIVTLVLGIIGMAGCLPVAIVALL